MTKKQLCFLDVLKGLIVVGGHGGSKVVALDNLAMLFVEACEPLEQGIA